MGLSQPTSSPWGRLCGSEVKGMSPWCGLFPHNAREPGDPGRWQSSAAVFSPQHRFQGGA